MEKRVSSRGIIIEDGKVYLMFRRRIKDDGTVKEYYVIPGGGIKESETLEENVKREMNEEFSVDVKIEGYLGKDEGEDSIAHFFSCSIIGGTPKLGGEEKERCSGNNYYEIQKIPIEDLDKIDVLAKNMIMKAYNKEYSEIRKREEYIMKQIVTNRDNLKEEDMTELVQRVKILLINSKKEILLGYSHHNYQFPGGHVEEGEDLLEAVNREVLEETGINLNVKNLNPFAEAIGYYKDWPEVGKNRKIEIYYFEVITDELPNLDNTNYTENEKDGNFELKYIPLDKVEKVIEENANEYGDKQGIAHEMLDLFKIYKSEK